MAHFAWKYCAVWLTSEAGPYRVTTWVPWPNGGCAASIYLRRFRSGVSRIGMSGECWKRTGHAGRSAERDSAQRGRTLT
jgi:hypothetical protein